MTKLTIASPNFARSAKKWVNWQQEASEIPDNKHAIYEPTFIPLAALESKYVASFPYQGLWFPRLSPILVKRQYNSVVTTELPFPQQQAKTPTVENRPPIGVYKRTEL